MPMSRIQRGLLRWLADSGPRMVVRPVVVGRTKDVMWMRFGGINDAIWGNLTKTGVVVGVSADEVTWDILWAEDVEPVQVVGGYVCSGCGEQYLSREEMWRRHLFEPLACWLSERLAVSDRVALYGAPDAKVLGER